MIRRQMVALGLGVGAVAVLARAARASRRISFKGRSVLITGGSRGLGLVVARRLCAEGALVTLAARDADELERAKADLLARGPFSIHTTVCDIGDRSEAEHLVRDVVERAGRLDVLINNAGVIQVGPLEHMEVTDFEEAMAVHFWGPLHTMLAARPFMRDQRFGRIVNVSSIGGRVAVPHLVPYCASKFALAGLSDAIRAEVRQDGIAVTTVAPGLMRTGSPFNAWFKGRNREEFTWFSILASLPGVSLNADAAARALVEACRYGDATCVIGGSAKLAVAANALVPSAVAETMALVNRFLPPRNGAHGDEAKSGWQSLSAWAPSRLTRLTERAARENNEVPLSAGRS